MDEGSFRKEGSPVVHIRIIDDAHASGSVAEITDPLGTDWSLADRAVLAFATKIGLNAYKVTEKDAISLREGWPGRRGLRGHHEYGLHPDALDRLANTLGVQPDLAPLVRKP